MKYEMQESEFDKATLQKQTPAGFKATFSTKPVSWREALSGIMHGNMPQRTMQITVERK